MSLKQRVHQILTPSGSDDRLSRAFDIFLVSIILLNVVAMLLESVRPVWNVAPWLFYGINVVSVVVFSVEYVLRVWSCTVETRYSHPITGRLRYMATPLAIVDLLAVLPFFIPLVDVDLRVARAVRLYLIFRIAKLTRYSQAMRVFGHVVRNSREELLTAVLGMSILILLASTLLYFAENDAQPDKFSSIPAAAWWAVITLTTVGYGDVVPITPVGRLLGGIVALLGIAVIALPTSILGAGFVAEIGRHKTAARQCPHCGEDIE